MISAYIHTLIHKKPSSGRALIELDGLRGFAVLIVIASHANALNMKGQGSMGVWLFFVLSGFLLTKIILHKLPGSLESKELAKYFIRRIARIIPLYYLCLIGLMFLRGHDFAWLFQHLIFMKSDGHLWSIPQEELFYILLPILTASTYWVSKLLPSIPSWAVAFAIAVIAAMNHPVIHLNGNYSTVPYYINIFTLGFLMGHLWSTKDFGAFIASRRYNSLLNVFSLFLLFAVLFTSQSHINFYKKFIDISISNPGWRYPTASGVVCALILIITLKTGTWLNRIFSLTFLRILGVLSFSLYLIHPAAIAFFEKLFHLEGLSLFAVSTLASLTVSLVIERVVERPFMDLGKKINSRLDSRLPAEVYGSDGCSTRQAAPQDLEVAGDAS